MDFSGRKKTGRKQERTGRRVKGHVQIACGYGAAFLPSHHQGDAERAPRRSLPAAARAVSRSFPVFSLLFGFCRNYLSSSVVLTDDHSCSIISLFFFKISSFLGL